MAIVVVIVVIPIMIAVPAVAVLVPPAMPIIPAAFPRFVQFVPRAIRLPAVPAVMLDHFVEFVVRLRNAALAIAVVIRARSRCSSKNRQADKRRRSEYGLSEKLLPSRLKFHILSILPYSPSGIG